MELDVFGLLGKTESQARLFFKKFCWKNGHVFCTRCKSYKIYRIMNKKYRCKRCGYTFHDFSNRWINKLNISYKQWMWLIKLFELEISSLRIAKQVRLSYPTVLRAATLLRAAILSNNDFLDGGSQDDLDLDELLWGKYRGKTYTSVSNNQVPLIGILKEDGMVKVRYIICDEAEFKLMKAPHDNKADLLQSKPGLQSYSYLLCEDFQSLKTGNGTYSPDSRRNMNGIESFLSFAKERLLKFHGISREKFFLYMKEMEYRYNHRQDDLFVLFVRNLCALLPFQMKKPL